MLKLDPWLSPFQDALKRRYAKAQEWIQTINEKEGGLDKFSKVSFCLVSQPPSHLLGARSPSQGTDIFGIQAKPDGTIVYREWAPNAIQASLIGDFSEFRSSLYSLSMPRF